MRLFPLFLATLLVFGDYAVAEAPAAPLPKAKHADAGIDPGVVSKLVGVWTNQIGSTFTITSVDAATGKLEGTYVTSSGAVGPFSAIGWVNTLPTDSTLPDNVVVISWTVRWGDGIGTITSWTGYLGSVGGTTKIVGQWNLAQPNSHYSWDHILAGQDQFTKNP